MGKPVKTGQLVLWMVWLLLVPILMSLSLTAMRRLWTLLTHPPLKIRLAFHRV